MQICACIYMIYVHTCTDMTRPVQTMSRVQRCACMINYLRPCMCLEGLCRYVHIWSSISWDGSDLICRHTVLRRHPLHVLHLRSHLLALGTLQDQPHMLHGTNANVGRWVHCNTRHTESQSNHQLETWQMRHRLVSHSVMHTYKPVPHCCTHTNTAHTVAHM